jgi:hypothetical protein
MEKFGLSYREVLNEPIDGFFTMIEIMKIESKEQEREERFAKLKQNK